MITLGNSTHQRILQVLVTLFKDEADVEAFGVFGSLARGDWDEYSDLDLDAIATDISGDKIHEYVEAMKSRLQSQKIVTLLSFEENTNEWVFILDSLDRISIRFHTLDETNPNIVDSFHILTGSLTIEAVAKAAARIARKETDFVSLQNKFIEHAIYVPVYLHRGELMNAINMLNVLRSSLMTIYGKSHGLSKIEKIERNAPQKLKDELAATFSAFNQESIRDCLASLLHVYITSIDEISSGKLHLSPEQKTILEKSISY